MALVVEYDGTAYAGFQLQSQQPTIQGAIESALHQLTGESIRIRGASRTDSGAHALGQVVDFVTESAHPAETFVRALNFYLPPDIRILSAYPMLLAFHSRRSACSRVYRYHLLNRPQPSALYRYQYHWVTEELDVAAMHEAAQDLVGCHDFRALAMDHPPDQSAVRQVSRWNVARRDEIIVLECEANGFLRHQIRRANAILVEIGKGRWPKSAVKDILEGNYCGNMAWPSLPAKGLCLIKVNYPNFWSQVRIRDEKD